MEANSQTNQELKATENENIVGDNLLNTGSTTDGDFNWFSKLPPELLRKILSYLAVCDKDENPIKNVLRVRAVHPLWKSVIEELLEEKRLEAWRNVELDIDNCRYEKPYFFSTLYFDFLLFPGSHSFLLCPLGIYKGIGTPPFSSPTSPFPSKSLFVTPPYEDWTVNFDRRIEFVDFFVHNGTHLSSLVLCGVTVDPETLAGVLKATPNLKALSLDDFTFIMKLFILKDDSGQQLHPVVAVNAAAHCVLPPLPNLQHIRILDTNLYLKYGTKQEELILDDDFNLYDWILEPYSSQLFTLDVDRDIGELGGARVFNFPMLKRLTIWGSTLIDMNTSSFIVPQLQVLCIGRFPGYSEVKLDRKILDLGVIQKHLERFSESLVELHLDLLRAFRGSKLEHYNPECGYRWSRNNVVFLKLKTLSIFYPKFSEELEAVKDMLGVMPKLEKLNFLRFYDSSDNAFNMEEKDDEEKVKTLLEQENYWQVCPNLKRISARRNVAKEGGPFVPNKEISLFRTGHDIL